MRRLRSARSPNFLDCHNSRGNLVLKTKNRMICAQSAQGTPLCGPVIGRAGLRKSSFNGVQLRQTKQTARTVRNEHRLDVHNFKFMKNLGLKKPDFLPDFGLEKRKALLDNLFTSFDQSSLQGILADDAKVKGVSKQGSDKSSLIAILSGSIKPSFPDFSWSHITTGEKDKEGYSIVKVQICGTHNGDDFTLSNSDLPPVKSSGKRLSLDEKTIRVKVEDGTVKEFEILSKGPDLVTDIYQELGGKVPASA